MELVNARAAAAAARQGRILDAAKSGKVAIYGSSVGIASNASRSLNGDASLVGIYE